MTRNEFILTKEDLERPENIDIRSLSFHIEKGHKINEGDKKIDYLVVSLPLSDPEDYIGHRHGLVIAASRDRIIVKTPKHRQSQYNTLGLYGTQVDSPTTDYHKAMATRMKTLIKSKQETKLVNIFSIKLPWKVTNKYTAKNNSGVMMYEEGELSASWADEKTFVVQEDLKTQWKYMGEAETTVIALMSLEFRVAIPETIEVLEVSIESATDNLQQLSIAASDKTVVADPSLGAW